MQGSIRNDEAGRGKVMMKQEEKKGMTPEELEEQNRQLKEENERLKREREEYRKTLPVKERLYDHVNVSLKTMDRIIAVLFILLGVVLVMGILNR